MPIGGPPGTLYPWYSVQYNGWVDGNNRFRVFLVLFLLTAVVIMPLVYSGYKELSAGRYALTENQYSDATRLFESAARKLFWRNDLWEQAGLAAFNNSDQINSIRLLEIARQRGSLTPQGWISLGSDYWINGDRTKALVIWKSALFAYPSSTLLYDQLIPAYHELGNYADEKDYLIKRLAIQDDALSHYRLGLLLVLSDPSKAKNEFTTSSSLKPEFKSVTGTLISTINTAQAEDDPSRKYVIIGRGLGLVDEWGLASFVFEEAADLDGMNAEAWSWLGEANQHQGTDGAAALDKALAIDPHDAVVLALNGLYWKRQGDYLKSIGEYQNAARLEPDNPAWEISLGESYTLNGDLVSALSAYQKAVTLVPNDPTYLRLLAMFSADNGVQVTDIGLPAAQKAIQIAPDDPKVLDALGWCYLNAGYLYNAEINLVKAVKIEPDLALAHVHLAEMYLRKGDRSSAFIELKNARGLDQEGAAGQLASQLLKINFP
jgi:tetratricopeptide (TPR) repeat protein